MVLNTTDDSREGIEKSLKINPTTNFVVVICGKIIGFIMSGQDSLRGYIYHIAVLEEYRNKGIAYRLVDEVMLANEGILCFMKIV